MVRCYSPHFSFQFNSNFLCILLKEEVSGAFGVVSKNPKYFSVNGNRNVMVQFCYKLPPQSLVTKTSNGSGSAHLSPRKTLLDYFFFIKFTHFRFQNTLQKNISRFSFHEFCLLGVLELFCNYVNVLLHHFHQTVKIPMTPAYSV